MKWIGLTGGIATGKSTVKNILSSMNIPVVDADLISHEITQVGKTGYEAIVKSFGEQILNTDRSLNRKLLGNMVFTDAHKLQQLEQILHPLIQAEVKSLKHKYFNLGAELCFYDVPLLFEKNMQAQFDKVVLVYAPLLIQIERLMRRNNLTHTEALVRINSQTPMSEKIKSSDYCLDNSTNADDLLIQVSKLVERLLTRL